MALSATLQLFLPWWSLIFAALLLGFFLEVKPGLSFLIGFCTNGILWLAIALWINVKNESILAPRLAEMFGLSGLWPPFLFTFVIAGLVGALAALTGSYTKKGFAST